MKVARLVKEYQDRTCPTCGISMKNHWAMRVTIPLEVEICGDCAYERKEFLTWLQDNLPAHIGDVKSLGVPMMVKPPARILQEAVM